MSSQACLVVFSSVGRATSYFSYASQKFVPKFAMATRVSRRKMQLAAFDGPSPKTPYRRKKSRWRKRRGLTQASALLGVKI